MTAATTTIDPPRRLFVPTVTKQCWGFMIGSAFFALGSAPGLSEALGSSGSNLLFFIGAWFFTTAGLIQLFLSGAISVPVSYPPGRMVRAEWLTAATQSFGTIMFNVSTTGALHAKTITSEERFVWNPDAGGSVAFLVSGFVAFIAYAHVAKLWDLGRRAWWSVFINFVGCVAFGISAVGAFILPSGDALSGSLANNGTFIGAICFLLASLIVLPFWDRNRPVAP
ncbi:hypothetical protein [Agromyces atrinae]|uniref:YrhK domain-containing protein n=1 Tax=Agromyces atrinae TaxID=592376 RepID=A0A4Q2M7B0_9MICO|nr:hypothetical protein [Agromyces atrinae]NYD67679.1 hypothetical protein [Agromyces atrinae]RXZ88124.1 hypothetical protein ESP50_02760 [Agromyces atrinae]